MNSDRDAGSVPPGEGNDQGRPRTVAIHTHGCKLNQADSQTLAREFREAGYQLVHPSAQADVVVLNTCTVTATADSKARQFLRAARRRNPDAVVVATGCYAQRAPAELEDLPGVSLVIGNTGKQSLLESVQQSIPQADAPPAPMQEDLREAIGRTRAMVKIQEGCDQVCAYCIVPKVRGRERSIPPEDIVSQINRHSAEGIREVALTGTQLGSYGFDLEGMTLVGLLQLILAETRVERLRVSSLQAHEITEDLLGLWRNSRLMPHFHIPLQSGCDTTLRAMRRRYDTDRFATAVESVRSLYPFAGVTTDIIVGFPGESAADFSESIDFVRAMRFSDIHAFPYSPRPGTSAVYLGGHVHEEDKRARMGEMLSLSAESRLDFRQSQLGSLRSVLWEKVSGSSGRWTGLTDNYLRVRTASDSSLSNRITGARLQALDGDWVTVQLEE